MMTALMDVGNTNIVLALHDGSSFVKSFRIHTDQKRTSDEYYAVFQSLLSSYGIERGEVSKAVVSSVVPNLTRAIEKDMEKLFAVKPLQVSKELETGLEKSSIPPELGSDLLANLAYAHYNHKERNVMVVDFGTALTFSTVDRKGNVLGVAITPGLVTAVNSLFGATAQLPQVELKIPSSALGRDSQDSIRSGIMLGYAGLVDKMVEKTEKEIGEDLYVVATGGLSSTIFPLLTKVNEIDPMHTLKGLLLIGSLN